MLILFLFILGIIIAAGIFVYKSQQNQKYIDYINENSIALEKLRALNQTYTFYPHINLDEVYSYDNEEYFKSISCNDYLIYHLQFNKTKILEQIGKIDFNNKHYKKYKNEVQSIQVFGEYKNPDSSLDPNLLYQLESKKFNSEIIIPTLHFDLKVTLKLTNMNGEPITDKRNTFSKEEIIELINHVNNRSGNFYNNKEIWDAICRVERGKVSNKMRFSIYQRDGYCCKCCGKSFDTDNLEIDHIKPIAKGGKSTLDNLQTLCRDCNLEKGTKFKRY